MTTAAELNATLPYATPDELEWLTHRAATLPSRARVVMIGGGPCIMGLAVLEGNVSLVLHILDIASLDYCETHIWAEFPKATVFYQQADSKQVEFRSDVDLLIVDGSHTYADVLHDARVWLPLLKAEGYAFFHDYDASGTEFEERERYPGVKQALHKYLKHQRDKYSFMGVVGTAAIVRRKA